LRRKLPAPSRDRALAPAVCPLFRVLVTFNRIRRKLPVEQGEANRHHNCGSSDWSGICPAGKTPRLVSESMPDLDFESTTMVLRSEQVDSFTADDGPAGSPSDE
jgi:hypothetical protein